MQHTATRSNTLYHIATHCDTLRHPRRKSTVCVYACVFVHIRVYVLLSGVAWQSEKSRQSVSALQYIPIHSNTTRCNRDHLGIGGAETVSDSTLSHGNTLQHTNYNTLQQRLPGNWRSRDSQWQYCITLQHTATHCNTLQQTATHCNTLQHNEYNTLKQGLPGDQESRQSVTTLHT